jgi:hypothetical protein
VVAAGAAGGSSSSIVSSSSKSVKVVDYLNEAYERACQYVKRSGLEGQEQLQALQVGDSGACYCCTKGCRSLA